MKESAESSEEDADLQPRGRAVLVQCNGFRCLAFRDRQGKWRYYFKPEEITGEVTVVEEDLPSLAASASKF